MDRRFGALFEDYFAWNEVTIERACRIGPFEVMARLTKHHVPTSALLVRCGTSSIGISSDTAFDPAHRLAVAKPI